MTPATAPTVSELAALIASWMVLSACTTGLLVVVSHAVQRVVRGAVPHRLVWGVALGTAALLTATQPGRRPESPRPVVQSLPAAATAVSGVGAAPSVAARLFTFVSAAPVAIASGVVGTAEGAARAAAAAVRTAPVPVSWLVVLGWPVGSLLLLAIGGWSYRRQRRALARTPEATMAGRRVHLTMDTGPAVFGVRHPRILVPAWLLDRPVHEQQLVVRHEQAHIDARDPLLLLGACVLTALMPWNPGAWYLLSRLRLAIEGDCDARVLRHGTTPRQYGALLIDLSSAATPLPPLTVAPSFSHRATHLERRLRRMTDRPTTHRLPRRPAGAALATLALATACGTELPTSAALEGMDVATATKTLNAVAPSAARQYFIDGRAATEVEALALPANRLATIEVMKAAKGVQAIRLTTRAATSATPTAAGTGTSAVAMAAVLTDSAANANAKVVTMRITQIDSTARALRIADTAAKLSFAAARAMQGADTSRALVIAEGMAFVPAGKTPDVLVFVDGVKSDEGALKRLLPSQIERIEVIKGAAAEKRYGPEGAKGVIQITTKPPR